MAIGTILAGAALSAGGSILNQGMEHIQRATDRKWQEKMANTAYQRSVADMEKAGLNPAQMFANGAGAPAQTGTPTTAHSAMAGNTAQIMNSIANTANAFNKDKNAKNDVTLNKLINAADVISKMTK